MRKAIRWVGVVCCSLAGLSPAAAEKRVALVIGNSIYGHHAALPNVPNDAAAMAALFHAAKFDSVKARSNIGVDELHRAITEFRGLSHDADIAVLFFAGHGIEVDGVNYLIPVDARLATDFDVERETVSVDRILRAMEPAKRLRLVILDACRENPFVKTMRRTGTNRSVGRGLGRVEPRTSNTLVAFAAREGALADDGSGRHSPFTAALVKHLLTPGLDLRIAFGRVRDDVLKSTASRQEPHLYGSVGGDTVSIVSGHQGPTTPPPVIVLPKPVDPEVADFELAERINTREVWVEFLRKYPNGMRAAVARHRLAALAPAPDAIETVRSFYMALASADGVRASSLVIPEKRAHGPFSPAEISKFYGSLTEPLRLTNVVALADDKFQVDYTFRAGKRSCNGFAIVTVVRRDGRPLIERIKANC